MKIVGENKHNKFSITILFKYEKQFAKINITNLFRYLNM